MTAGLTICIGSHTPERRFVPLRSTHGAIARTYRAARIHALQASNRKASERGSQNSAYTVGFHSGSGARFPPGKVHGCSRLTLQSTQGKAFVSGLPLRRFAHTSSRRKLVDVSHTRARVWFLKFTLLPLINFQASKRTSATHAYRDVLCVLCRGTRGLR